mmetsp:Transcript_31974/g.56499  ORF Transcript_31974/g.56499 Transcript_31974/m.56499 type:complete len:618 (-) Transcript_31974:14-1867(-)
MEATVPNVAAPDAALQLPSPMPETMLSGLGSAEAAAAMLNQVQTQAILGLAAAANPAQIQAMADASQGALTANATTPAPVGFTSDPFEKAKKAQQNHMEMLRKYREMMKKAAMQDQPPKVPLWQQIQAKRREEQAAQAAKQPGVITENDMWLLDADDQTLSFEDRIKKARLIAGRARDSKKGAEALVNLWREVSKPRKEGTIPAQPPGCKLDCPMLLEQWFEARGLLQYLHRVEDQKGWAVYKYVKEPLIRSEPDWEQAFHGTWWYSVWLILHTGVFLESNDRALGHDYWEPGVYCSPNLDTGLWYSRPQILFGDGVYHRIIFELRVNSKKRKVNRKRGGVQWVFPSAAVALDAVWVRFNAPPCKGEERVRDWDPTLEALPPARERPPAVVNPRTEPWPYMMDDWPWELDGSNVPPWMRTFPTKPETPNQFKAAAGMLSSTPGSMVVSGGAAGTDYGSHALGGLYGHWLRKDPAQRAAAAGAQVSLLPAQTAPPESAGSAGDATTEAESPPTGDAQPSRPQPRGSLGVAQSKRLASSISNGADGAWGGWSLAGGLEGSAGSTAVSSTEAHVPVVVPGFTTPANGNQWKPAAKKKRYNQQWGGPWANQWGGPWGQMWW